MRHQTRFFITLALTLASLAFAGANIYDEYLIPVRPMDSAYNENRQWPGETDEEHAQRLEETRRVKKALAQAQLDHTRDGYLITFVYWSILPVVALAAVVLFGERSVGRSFFGLSFFYALAYASYAFSGPSDPMGAGHMHLVLVPMLLLLITFAPLFLNFLDLFSGKGKKRGKPVENADETS